MVHLYNQHFQHKVFVLLDLNLNEVHQVKKTITIVNHVDYNH
jgi:hypothetical protein